jgi:two-component system response regulator YesN
MIQLLIVDDEGFIVEDIKSSVNWAKLGIGEVFTAYNMRRAKEVFENNKIDVMLCDIEMPQGNGLELLSWVRENSPKTESIFLTCHEDFKYAKEAIRLGCLEYILKPIPYEELEAAIGKAIKKIKKDSELEEYSRFGQFWFKHQPLIVERFWLDIINQEVPSSPEHIKAAAEQRNIPYSEEMKILPILIGVQRWQNKLSQQDEKVMEFGLKNIAEELLASERKTGQFFQLQSGEMLGILALESEESLDKTQLIEKCKDFIESSFNNLKCSLSCYIGNPIPIYELSGAVKQLSALKKNNVAFYNKVIFSDERNMASKADVVKDMNIWTIMLREGSYKKLVGEVEEYLEQTAITEGLDINMLYRFQQDFIQIVYAELEEKGIHAHQILRDDKTMELYVNATNSVVEMVEWVRNITENIAVYDSKTEKEQSPISKAKKYIKLNLEQELSREEVANHVYLNPDYLDRLFKREEGVSVAKYILQERFNMAKELLSNTAMPISTIAVSVGYGNLSNFSSMFKKISGVNPVDYRKNSVKK